MQVLAGYSLDVAIAEVQLGRVEQNFASTRTIIGEYLGQLGGSILTAVAGG